MRWGSNMQPTQFSKKILGSIVDIAWAVWNRLGVYGSGNINRCSSDIESALVLASLAGIIDLRLMDGSLSWLVRYHEIISAERLKILLKDTNDDFVSRCIGAMIETTAIQTGSKRFNPFLEFMGRMLKERMNDKTIISLARSPDAWVEKDTIFKRWGLAKTKAAPGSKIQNHEWIVKNNMVIRYRYLFGISARPDILYALLVFAGEGKPVDIARLSACLGYNHSSVFRVMKDFERGGYIEFSGTKRSQKARWQHPSGLALDEGKPDAVKYLNWRSITSVLTILVRLLADIVHVKNEMIVKHKLAEFHDRGMAPLRESGLKHVPLPIAKSLDSLSSQDIMDSISSFLSGMEDEITGITTR